MTPKPNVRYITAKLAQQIDEELMSSSGAFSLDQLMELAGLSCAQALAKSFPLPKYRRVLVCCGPGNQGGDGLVAARHLHHLSYSPTVFLPKPGKKDIYQRLLKQCENLDIKVLEGTGELEGALKESDVVMDAIFGFSFQPPLRPPFHTILTALRQSSLPIISIDIPSGWDVERGRQRLETVPDEKTGEVEVVETFEPEVLVSLTVPKLGVEQFGGRHWLGGRFVPGLWNEGRVEEHCAGASIVCACVQGDLAQKYELNIPPYEGLDQVVELPRRSVKE